MKKEILKVRKKENSNYSPPFLIQLLIATSSTFFWLFLFLKDLRIEKRKLNDQSIWYFLRNKLTSKEISFREGVIGFPTVINPLFLDTSLTDYSQVDKDISYLIFSSLIKKSGNDFVPDLAKELPEIKENGKIFRFRIKENVFWHDGEKFTADDILYTIDTLKSIDFPAGEKIAIWEGIKVEKIDDYTVDFILPFPNYDFTENFTQGIVPKHILESTLASQMLNHSFGLSPIGTGPFKFAGRTFTNEIKLEKNPSYYGKIPEIDFLYFKFFRDKEELLKAFEKKQIDGFISQNSTGQNSYRLGIEQEKTLLFLNSKSIDQSLRKFIFSVLVENNIGRESLFSIEDEFNYGEKEKNKEELLSAGFKIGEDGIIKKSDGQEITLTLICLENNKTISEKVSKILESSGLKTKVEILQVKEFWNKANFREYDILIIDLNFQKISPYLFFHSNYNFGENGFNFGRLEEKKIDISIEEYEINGKKDKNLKNDLYRRIKDKAVVLLLGKREYFYNFTKAMDIKFNNIPTIEDRFFNISQWNLEKETIIKIKN